MFKHTTFYTASLSLKICSIHLDSPVNSNIHNFSSIMPQVLYFKHEHDEKMPSNITVNKAEVRAAKFIISEGHNSPHRMDGKTRLTLLAQACFTFDLCSYTPSYSFSFHLGRNRLNINIISDQNDITLIIKVNTYSC